MLFFRILKSILGLKDNVDQNLIFSEKSGILGKNKERKQRKANCFDFWMVIHFFPFC